MTDDAIITPTDNGPYHVRGRFKIVLPRGQELETDDETWLCRCGASQTKPFCDGAHTQIGFAAAEAAVAHAAAGHDAGDDFQPVARAGDVAEGEMIGVEVAGRPVVIGRVDDRLYAIGGVCTHQYARLENGVLEDEVVLCPLHNSGFNIKTGAPVRLPAVTPVPTYTVAVEGDAILVSREPMSTGES